MSKSETYQFIVHSRRHGQQIVTAPVRFRRVIQARQWAVSFVAGKAVGHQLYICTTIPHPGGGLRACGKRRRRTRLYLHQLVWSLSGKAVVKQIDHRDGDPLNNGEDNLRDGTEGNQWNRGLQKNNTTGVKGISRRNGTFRATISAKGKAVELGAFKTLEAARRARNDAAARLHGEFAVRS